MRPFVLLLLVSLASGSAVAAPGTSSVQSIALADGLPSNVTITFERRGTPVTLELSAHSERAQGFRLRAWADGVTSVLDAPAPASYRGHVLGEPGSVVGGALTPAGWRLSIFEAGAGVTTIEPLALSMPGASRELHLITEDAAWPADRTCGSDALEEVPGTNSGSAEMESDSNSPGRELESDSFGGTAGPGEDPRLGRGGAPRPTWCGRGTISRAEIAFDVDQVYYRNLGSDIAVVTANVEAHLAAINAFYERDVLITHEMTDLIIRTTDFYLPDTTQGSLLGLFRDEWNANQTAVPRDIAHLMTGQPAPGLAGLAYVGVVCNLAWCYGWSVDSSGVLGHEVGHNWSAGHCHDTAPCNNMCGACLFIGPNTKAIIESFRDSRACLDTLGPATNPAAPYATADRATITRDQLALRLTVPLDVLANDHDANCEDISITAFDATSALGGSIALDAGAGPLGRDLLVYTPPCAPFSGDDTFSYTIGDGAGGSATANVAVSAPGDSLAALWPLDEGAGLVAGDASAQGRDATLQGGAAWIAGRSGGALSLDGVDDHATVPALGLRGLPVTITAWVRRSGAQAGFAGLLFSRAAGTTAGLHVGNANELRYTWQDSAATWGADSGLILPDGAWAFVALVVEPSQATLYLDDGTWRSFVNSVPHGAQTFAGEVSLGRDPTGGRFFRGDLDEIRVFDGALSVAELQALRDLTPRVEAPSPADGSFVSDPDATLSWRGSASEHDVYLGTDLESVRVATPSSTEYQGRVTGTSFNPPGLFLEGQAQAWRVDPVAFGIPQPGAAWTFTVKGSDERLLGYWRFDEGSGVIGADATPGARDANLVNGAGWGVGPLGGSLVLDGANDQALIPALDRPLDELTIVTWLRTTGTPAPWAGIAFCRGGSTTAGLNFRDTNELGYHWDGGQWGWASGLVVPPDTWVLVALAISPTSATIFLHDGSAWSSATNAAGHGAEAFDASLALGRDPWGAARSLAGELDDVRLFDVALDQSQLEVLRTSSGRAMDPLPRDGETLLTSPTQLSWVPGASVLAHDLYFGTDAAAVSAATIGSPEHLGSPAAPLQAVGTLAAGTYYWRVDETTTAGLERGELWRFRVFGSAPDALRVVKTVTGEPRLTWSGVAAAGGFAVQRCAAPAPSCVPAIIASVPASQRAWDDPAASEPLIWYQVDPDPCLP